MGLVSKIKLRCTSVQEVAIEKPPSGTEMERRYEAKSANAMIVRTRELDRFLVASFGHGDHEFGGLMGHPRSAAEESLKLRVKPGEIPTVGQDYEITIAAL